MLDIMRLADKLGVEFASSIQTVHLFKQEHGVPPEAADTPTSMTDRRAMIHGIGNDHDLVANQPCRDETHGPVEYKHGPTQLDGEDDSPIEQRSAGG